MLDVFAIPGLESNILINDDLPTLDLHITTTSANFFSGLQSMSGALLINSTDDIFIYVYMYYD